MGWLKTDFRFDIGIKTFTISHKSLLMCDEIKDLLKMADEHTNLVAEGIAGIIDREHPELKGCVVFGLNYNMQYQQWEISVCHRSIPTTPPGQAFPSEPLRVSEEPVSG